MIIANAHSQAHLQFAQANPLTKNCKRACLFATPKSKVRSVLKLKKKKF